MKRWLTLCLILWLMLTIGVAAAEVEEVYTLVDEHGSVLTTINHQPSRGDEYIAGDNRHYRVRQVQEQQVVMELVGVFAMPDVSWLTEMDATQVSALVGGKRIALYCTHSDESYVPTDGAQSRLKDAGIYDVAEALSRELESRGVTVDLDDTSHNPHDAGAYRRSRQTAARLIQNRPDAIFDIHRDGIPDPKEYQLQLGGESLSKIRILVGRGNQNASTNKAFAVQLKAVADQVYPGLIKDIYMGKGVYNQDLSPKSVLLEMGTHTLSKDRVLNAAAPMSDVIHRTLYGGLIGAAGASDVAGTPVQSDVKEAGTGIGWLLVAVLIGGGAFALVTSGSLKGAKERVKRTASEVTGGLIGKKPKK